MKNKRLYSILFILFCIGLIFGNPTTHSPWDGTKWDLTSPNDEALVGNTYRELYDLRKGVELRYEYEHSTLTEDAAASGGGVHLQGSAVCYHQDAIPTLDGDGEEFTTAANAGHLWFDTNEDDELNFLNTADGGGVNVWTPIYEALQVEAYTWTANHIWDDGTTDSPSITLTDATNEDCAIVKLDNGDTTVTIPADTDFEIDTGNLAVGDGTPGTAAMDGEDAYIEGDLEVDGTVTLDGAVTIGTSLTLAAGSSPTEFSIDDTLAGDSDTAIPTEQAVKAYVDTNRVRITGEVLQIVNAQVQTPSTGTTAIPSDDTIPQITEGDQRLTLAITPASASSELKIDVVVYASQANAADMVAALFNTDYHATNCMALGMVEDGANQLVCIAFTHFMTTPSGSATTFTVRLGAESGNTYFNRVNGTDKYNDKITSSITITEIKE